MRSKYFSFFIKLIKKTIINSKIITSINYILSFNAFKSYKDSSSSSKDPIPINTKIIFYIITVIIIVCLIIYIISIFFKRLIRYHIAIFIGFLFQLLNSWLLSQLENKADIKFIVNNTIKYFLIRSNKVINMILNLILMNLNIFSNESFFKLIFFYIIKLIVFYLIEINYFDGINIKGSSFMYIPISINSAFTLLIIIYYTFYFKKLRKFYKNFVHAGFATDALNKKFKVVYIVFFIANIFELISCIVFNYFFYSYNLNMFIIYHYLDFIMIVIYFILYFPVRDDIGNIADYMRMELIRREILDILTFDEMIAHGQLKKLNIYKLDNTENIKEKEYFDNINNDCYIIVENPYLTEENNDMNKLISNNFYYGNIMIGYIKNEIK